MFQIASYTGAHFCRSRPLFKRNILNSSKPNFASFKKVMLQQGSSVDIDWMSLAAKMFMTKMNNKNSTQKQYVEKKTSTLPLSPPLQARSPLFSVRTRVQDSTVPTHLPPDCVATIKQFEALRMQLLRQLVLYQTQLLALKMPPIPGQLTNQVPKTVPPKAKIVHEGPNKLVKQTTSKKLKNSQGNNNKKWEKVQLPVFPLKTTNKRQSQIVQKPNKSSKKASKRKLENDQKPGSNNHDDNNLSKMSKTPLSTRFPPFQACLDGYSSSTDSCFSSKQGRYNNFSLKSLKVKDAAYQNNIFPNFSSTAEIKNKNTSILKSPKRKLSKLNKIITSTFISDTPTDEVQSSL